MKNKSAFFSYLNKHRIDNNSDDATYHIFGNEFNGKFKLLEEDKKEFHQLYYKCINNDELDFNNIKIYEIINGEKKELDKYKNVIDLKTFLDVEEILYLPFYYFINIDENGNKKKKPIGEKNNLTIENIKIEFKKRAKLSKPNEYYIKSGETYKTIKLTEDEKNSLVLSYTIFLKHSKYYCIDIDDKSINTLDDYIKILENNNVNESTIETIKKCCWVKGNTKGIHIYIKFLLSDIPPNYSNQQDVLNFVNGDFIKKNNMWEGTHKMVYNYDNNCYISFNDIKELINVDKLNNNAKKSIKKENKNNNEIEDDEDKPVITVNANYPLLNILASHFKDYSEWSRMCWIMKSLNYKFEVFDEYSSKFPTKYNKNDCKDYWDRCKITDKITEGILHSLAKQENPKEYDKLKISYNYKEDIIPVETITMTDEQIKKNDGYLIHKDNKKLDFKDCIISNKLKEFFSSDIKSFNIKSPYDTGKTQLLSKIMTVYKQKRVLFLSYRKTLTSDLMNSFSKLGFQDYRDAICNKTDKLIIQLESINKIKPSFMFVDEEFEIPSYDLVIIDEVESILQQFNSDTFKGDSKNSFEFIDAIIKNSNKLITLDGDLSFRGFNYIKYFGDSINIINPVKKNLRTFTIIDDKDIFLEEIKQSLNNNKKIVIVSQSSEQCYHTFNLIKQDYDDLKVAIYTGISNDKDKDDLKNVLENWTKLDVLIYSPTIESGVNFDIEHFDKIYGIISSGCNSQRAFCQMLSRVRKIKDSNITLWGNKIGYNKINKYNIYTFDEVKNCLLTLDIIKINETIEGNKMTKRLTHYDINFCYNKIEELMKNKFFYVGYLEYLLTNKGHTVINKILKKEELDADRDEEFERNKDKKKKSNKEKYPWEVKQSEILEGIDDITENKFKYLLQKQKQGTSEEFEKLQIKKYLIKSSLGLDKIDGEILKYYDSPYIIKNIEHLIDKSNIIQYDDNQSKELIKKVDIINDLINKLGFKLFANIGINRDEFEKNIENVMKTNEIFINPKIARVLFNSSKSDIKTNKQFLGFVNSILEHYKLKIYSREIREGKGKSRYYELDFLNNYCDINNFIQIKIDKGYKLNDTNNIRPIIKINRKEYGNYILTDEEKIKYYEELEKRDEERYMEEINKEIKNNKIIPSELDMEFPDPYGLDYGV